MKDAVDSLKKSNLNITKNNIKEKQRIIIKYNNKEYKIKDFKELDIFNENQKKK